MTNQKIVICINNLQSVNSLAYGNHLHFFYRLGRQYNGVDGPLIDFQLWNPQRMSIDRSRNSAAKIALNNPNVSHVLMLDDDVLVFPGDLQKLLDADKDIIAGITYIRGFPYHPMLFDFEDLDNHYVDDYKNKADKDGLVKVDAVGFSFCLIKTSLLREMSPPFFITGERHTEDVYFCKAAKVQKPDVTIYGHSGVQTSHILSSIVINHQLIDPQKAYDIAVNPRLGEPEEKGEDHGLTYYESIGAIAKPTDIGIKLDDKA